MTRRSKKKDFQYYYKRGAFVPMFHEIWDSEAYQSLTPKARCLLLELQRAEFPNRNGKIGMSEKRAAKLLGVVENTASAAFDELIDKGFIYSNFEGDWRNGQAREWTVTYLAYMGKEPTDDWKNYTKK